MRVNEAILTAYEAEWMSVQMEFSTVKQKLEVKVGFDLFDEWP